MTAILCPACGAIDTPRVAPGGSPHWGKVVCAHCSRCVPPEPTATVGEVLP
jgi:hypothetical protein